MREVRGREDGMEKRGRRGGARAYHGIPSSNCCCSTMKLAKIPMMVVEAASMIRIQKLSCSAGQWYFVRTRCKTISVIVLSVEAISVVRFAFLLRVPGEVRCWVSDGFVPGTRSSCDGQQLGNDGRLFERIADWY